MGFSCAAGADKNAFCIMMDAAKRLKNSAASKQSGKVSVQFPYAWQQPLFQRAMSPEKFKSQNPDMEVDDVCIVVKDAYPKAKHHFLVIARDLQLEQLTDLKKEHCAALQHMMSCAEKKVLDLKQEGAEFKFGFHSKPSMRQLHMHVISSDFESSALKNRKHWNSFTTSFFMEYESVVKQLGQLGRVVVDNKAAAQALKEPLQCHRCKKICKNMALLKTHISLCNLMSSVQ